MSVRHHIARRALVFTFSVSAGLMLALPYAHAEQSSLERECNNANPDQAYAVGGQEFAKYNTRCDHDRMLKAGNTVYAIYEKYCQKKVELIEADPTNVLGASPKASYIADGTCFGSDATLGDCVKRLKRNSLDASAQVRENVLRHNTGAAELLVTKGKTLVGGLTDGSEVNQTKNAILKDFYAATHTKGPNAAQERAAQIQKLLTPSNVSFTTPNDNAPKIGDAIIKSGDSKLNTAESLDIKKINSDYAKQTTVDTTEVNSNKKDLNITATFEKARNDLSSSYQQDQSTARKIAEDPKAVKTPDEKALRNSISVDALEKSLDDYDNGVRAKSEKKTGIMDSNDVDITITPPTQNTDNSIIQGVKNDSAFK